MINTVVIQGLKIETNCKKVKFTKSVNTRVVQHVNTSVLEILFVNGRKSSDIVSKGIKLVKDVELQETKYLTIENPTININGLIFKKIVLHPFVFSQFIVEDIKDFIVYSNNSTLIVLIPTNRQKDFEGYIKAINSSDYLVYTSAETSPSLSSVSLAYINTSGKVICSNNTVPIKTVADYSKYLIRSVDVFYYYLLGLDKRLQEFGMDLLGYPISEYPNTSNFIRWKLTDKDKRVQRVTGMDFLNHAAFCKATMNMEASFTDLVMYDDFVYKYQSYQLITNYTEWLVPDVLGRLWRCTAMYSPLPTDYDSSNAENSEGNFSYTVNFQVDLYYYIVEDTKAYKVYKIIHNLLSSKDPLST